MEQQKKLRLAIQCSMPVDTPEEGQQIFEQFRLCIESVSPGVMFSGQIVEPLGPCCGEKGHPINALQDA